MFPRTFAIITFIYSRYNFIYFVLINVIFIVTYSYTSLHYPLSPLERITITIALQPYRHSFKRSRYILDTYTL